MPFLVSRSSWSCRLLLMTGTYFVDSQRARNDLEAFARANEARLYKLFKQCCDPTFDLRTVVKARVS